MEDKLVLGIQDTAQANAPQRRFDTSDLRSRSNSVFLLPLFSISWAAILLQLFGEKDEGTAETAEHPDHDPQGQPERDVITNTLPQGGGPWRHGHSLSPQKVSNAHPVNSGGDANEGWRQVSTLVPETFTHTRHLIANDNLHVTAYSPSLNFTPPAPSPRQEGSNGQAGGSSSLPHVPISQDQSNENGQNGSGGSGDQGPPMPVAKQLNRRPMVSGPVVMNNGLMNEAIIISMGELLVGATDADGDELSVKGLTVDSGDLKWIGFDMWLYTPAADKGGPVAFHYAVSDGQESVVQSASLSLVKPGEQEITGTDGDDILVGTPFVDVIDAKVGDDIVYGGESNDIIYGGDGNDRLIGGDGNDIIFGGNGNDILFGGNGDDTLFGDDGNDVLYGDDGRDLLFGGNGDDRLHGGNDDDHLMGDAGNDTLNGDAGNDTLEGGDGNDFLQGDAGDDVLVGDAGDDTLDGGDGNDLLLGGDGNDAMDGGAGENTIRAGGGDDVIRISNFSSMNAIDGGEGNDLLDLSAAEKDSTIDLIEGRAEVDGIECATIVEIENIRGGAGNDRLVANDHVNILIGGAGNDIFVFRELETLTNENSGSDRISDFEVGDRIDFSKLGDTIENFAEHKFFFTGLASSTPSEIGELRYEHSFLSNDTEMTVVKGHVDEDVSHDFALILDGYHDLTANDFILAAREIENHSA